MRNVEVNEQSDFMITELQVGQDLSEMKGKQFLHCLQFDDDAVFDKEVDPVSRIYSNALIYDRKPHLMFKSNTVQPELVAKASIVRTFQTAGAECGVDLHRRTKNLFRDRIVQHKKYYLRVLLTSVVDSFRMQPPVL